MGPKKEGSKGSATGMPGAANKKKQNEDMMRKLQEEEEVRKKAEEEERDRKRKEAEVLAKNKETAKTEKKSRRIQLGELEAIVDYNKSCAERVDTERRQLYKWERYLRCDGTPDPTIPAEINTYINMLLEEPRSSVDDAFAKCKVLLALVSELQFIIDDMPPGQISPENLEQYKTTLARMECLIQYKLDQATYEELLHASENLNPETSNLERVLRTNDLLALCVWGNLIKNPRIRSHEFPEIGFTFEIPKPIGNSSVAVRVLHTAFDHCSHLTRTFYPKKKFVEVVEEKAVEVVEEKKVEKVEVKETAHEDEDILAQLNFLDKPKPKVEEKAVVVEEEDPEYDAAPTPPPEEYEDYEEPIDVVDLRQNQPVGGVYHINLLQLPPQPKTINNWTIRLLQSPAQLHFVDYIATTTHYYPVAVSLAGPMAQTLNFALGFTNMQHTLGSTAAGQTLAEGGHEKGADAENKEKEVRPPVPIVLKLPPTVMFFESPQVARWHDERKCWVSDAVTNLQYKEDQRVVSFRLERFGIFTLVQDRHVNMPFQSWEMHPLGTGRCIIHVVAAIAEVEVEINNDQCALVKPDDKSELQHLVGKFMPVDQLIEAMKNSGINLFPEPDSYKFVGVQNKNHLVEKRVYQNMALVASGMAFSWSKWNADCNDMQRIVMQAISWAKTEPPAEDDWKLVEVERRRAAQLIMTEFGDNFNDERVPDQPYFASLFHLSKHMCGGAESANWSRVVDSPYQFALTVERFLSATRLLVFS